MPETPRFTVGDLCRQLIETDIEAARDQLSNYACADFSEYAYACGMVAALRTAVAHLKEAEERVQREND